MSVRIVTRIKYPLKPMGVLTPTLKRRKSLNDGLFGQDVHNVRTFSSLACFDRKQWHALHIFVL